jgi:hypothetical protein
MFIVNMNLILIATSCIASAISIPTEKHQHGFHHPQTQQFSPTEQSQHSEHSTFPTQYEHMFNVEFEFQRAVVDDDVVRLQELMTPELFHVQFKRLTLLQYAFIAGKRKVAIFLMERYPGLVASEIKHKALPEPKKGYEDLGVMLIQNFPQLRYMLVAFEEYPRVNLLTAWIFMHQLDMAYAFVEAADEISQLDRADVAFSSLELSRIHI